MARVRSGSSGAGLAVAVASAAMFGTSGSFATSLIDAGWSPGAAVTTRISIAALVLLVPAVFQLRRVWPQLRAGGRPLLLHTAKLVSVYGLVAIAGCQLFYFHAVQRLSVGVALLMEYLGIILVVGWLWLRHGHRPRRLTVLGSIGALVGLALVLDLTGSQHVDFVGILWGLGAAVGLAVYFVLSAREDSPLPPIAMACGGMLVGAVTFLVLGPGPRTPDACDVRPGQLLRPPHVLAGAGARVVGRGRRLRLRHRHRGRAAARRQAVIVRRADRGAVRGAVRLAAARSAAHGHASCSAACSSSPA